MNERAELEQLLRELLLGIQDTLSSGERLSDDFQGLLAETISNLTNRIDELGQTEQIQQQPVANIPEMPAGVDLLYILANGDINSFVSYLRTYPGAGLVELANDPIRLNQVFTQLQNTIPINQPQIGTDGIPNIPAQSSNVSGIKYVPEQNKLYVRFHGEPIEPIYEYKNVPMPIAELILAGAGVAKTSGKNRFGFWWRGKNPSWGASINQFLKQGGFPYQRIK